MNSKKINVPIDQMLSTQKEGRAAGHMKYFTGGKCIHGHLSPRYVSNRRCTDCAVLRWINTPDMMTEEEKREKRRAYYQANKEKYRAYNRNYWEENKKELTQKDKEYRKANKELCHEKDREKYLRN